MTRSNEPTASHSQRSSLTSTQELELLIGPHSELARFTHFCIPDITVRPCIHLDRSKQLSLKQMIGALASCRLITGKLRSSPTIEVVITVLVHLLTLFWPPALPRPTVYGRHTACWLLDDSNDRLARPCSAATLGIRVSSRV